MNLVLVKSYFRYLFQAKHRKAHGVHSPFLFSLIVDVFNKKNHNPAFDKIEQYRKILKKNKTIIDSKKDLGAGSKQQKKRRQVADIAKVSLTKSRYAKLLYALGTYYNAVNILELGTSLGITTQYLASIPNSKITTIEGNPLIADMAQHGFEKLNYSNIDLVCADFTDYLKDLEKTTVYDFIFIDGNHRKEATITYFEKLLNHAHNDTILVFDDIHWSEGMEEAWKHIVAHSATTLTIDIFQFGLVFLRKELSKQHFVIRY